MSDPWRMLRDWLRRVGHEYGSGDKKMRRQDAVERDISDLEGTSLSRHIRRIAGHEGPIFVEVYYGLLHDWADYARLMEEKLEGQNKELKKVRKVSPWWADWDVEDGLWVRKKLDAACQLAVSDVIQREESRVIGQAIKDNIMQLTNKSEEATEMKKEFSFDDVVVELRRGDVIRWQKVAETVACGLEDIDCGRLAGALWRLNNEFEALLEVGIDAEGQLAAMTQNCAEEWRADRAEPTRLWELVEAARPFLPKLHEPHNVYQLRLRGAFANLGQE